MIPVTLFVYNRPEHTKRTLEALRTNNIDLLYVFSDAAKVNSNDILKVEEVRRLIDSIDWVETRIFKRAEHAGIANSVTEGVSAVLDSYDKVIVLEDDCIASPYFYSYMCQCLKQYEGNDKISVVSAFLPPIKKHIFRRYPYDIFFWGRFFSFGWGTWRRAWKDFNPRFGTLLQEIRKRDIDTSLFDDDVKFDCLVEQMFKADSWATPFFINMVLRNSLGVMPVRSYIKNIGFDGSGTHGAVSSRYELSLEHENAKKNLMFPSFVMEDKKIIKALVSFINKDKSFLEKSRELYISPLIYLFSRSNEIFTKIKRYIYKRYHNIISIGPIYYIVGDLKDNSIVVDVGAGSEAEFSKELIKLFGLRSFGFDPTRKHHEFLEALSEKAGPFFKFYKFALSENKGTKHFYETRENVSGSFYHDHTNIKSDKILEYDVETITLKDIFSLLNTVNIDLIKLDIEGEEYAVLGSAGKEVFERISQLVVEFHHGIVDRFTMADTQRVVEYLKGLGYIVYTKDTRNYLFFRNE